VTITAFDRFGNRVNHGGNPFRVAVNQGTPLAPTDNGNGTYTRNLNLSVGVFRIDITLGGQALSGNPFQILVPFPFSGCPGSGG
jgi:flagellar basal body rod protein FlgF